MNPLEILENNLNSSNFQKVQELLKSSASIIQSPHQGFEHIFRLRIESEDSDFIKIDTKNEDLTLYPIFLDSNY